LAQDFTKAGAYGSEGAGQWEAWGGEDVHLWQTLKANPGLVLFRAYEPELVHIWHPKHCPKNLRYAIPSDSSRHGIFWLIAAAQHSLKAPLCSPQMAWNCQKVMLNNLGSQHELAQAVRALGIDTRPLRYKDYWWKGKAGAGADPDGQGGGLG
jgi:hypothetical protein